MRTENSKMRRMHGCSRKVICHLGRKRAFTRQKRRSAQTGKCRQPSIGCWQAFCRGGDYRRDQKHNSPSLVPDVVPKVVAFIAMQRLHLFVGLEKEILLIHQLQCKFISPQPLISRRVPPRILPRFGISFDTWANKFKQRESRRHYCCCCCCCCSE